MKSEITLTGSGSGYGESGSDGRVSGRLEMTGHDNREKLP